MKPKRSSNYAPWVPCPNAGCTKLKHPDGKECKHCAAVKKGNKAKAARIKLKGIDAQPATCNGFPPDRMNTSLDVVASTGCKATVETCNPTFPTNRAGAHTRNNKSNCGRDNDGAARGE